MTPYLLTLICDPITKKSLTLVDEVYDNKGNIDSGLLIADDGSQYSIVNGIPRFINSVSTDTVNSFGDEWNHFNYTDFKKNWLSHVVKNTFGSVDVFFNKVIVDAGGGSGAQAKWFSEYGAKHVIVMDLSHSVDGVMQKNFQKLDNIDVIQCSIDQPPLRDRSINGIVYCHNVIQHTPSVVKTAESLYSLVDSGGEFVFNCYPLNDQGVLRWVRVHIISKSIRAVLSKTPFFIIKLYAIIMGVFRLIPGVGFFLEKSGFCVQGDVPSIVNESKVDRIKRRFALTVINTFDNYGSHHYQHLVPDNELKKIVYSLQPDSKKILNMKKYFLRPQLIGTAIRIFR